MNKRLLPSLLIGALGIAVVASSLVRVPQGSVALVSWRGGGTPALLRPGWSWRVPVLQRVERLAQGGVTIERIVEVASPRAVVLFGSFAEGRPHRHSDFDFIVIADAEDTGALTGDLYEALADLTDGRWGEFPPTDIIVLTPDEWEHEAQLPGLVCSRARRHGVVVYRQAA